MWFVFFSTVAWADEQRLMYDLFLDKADVGDRELTIRYLSREDGERRVLSVVTKAETPLGSVSCRQSAQSSPRGANFTTSMQLGAEVSQVQGIQLPTGGWQLVVADAAGVAESTLRAGQARITTLDLYDPGRTVLLTQPGPVGILIAETGRILDGELKAGEPVSIKIGGKATAVTKYVLEGAGGKGQFYVDDNGVLLRSDLDFFGGTMSTVARAVPEARNFGTIDVVDSPGAGVQEAEL
jgi:hypothetical protein